MSKDDSDDESEYISNVSEMTMPVVHRGNDDTNGVSDILSAETDEESETKTKSFLKYKHPVKKSFKTSKNLSRYAEHLAKVENALMGKRKDERKAQVQSEKIQMKSIKKCVNKESDSNMSLTASPSELVVAPSDFEHMFHQKIEIDPQITTKPIVNEKEEKESKEKEIMFKIFKNYPKLIPIYTLDENSSPQMLQISLSRLNLLSKMYAESCSSKNSKSDLKKIKDVSKNNVQIVEKDQKDQKKQKEIYKMNLLKIKNMIKPFVKPDKSQKLQKSNATRSPSPKSPSPKPLPDKSPPSSPESSRDAILLKRIYQPKISQSKK